jgi:hypothetical protein
MTTYHGSNINIDDSWYVQQSNDPVEKDEVTQNKGLVQLLYHRALLGSSQAPDSFQIDLDYRS